MSIPDDTRSISIDPMRIFMWSMIVLLGIIIFAGVIYLPPHQEAREQQKHDIQNNMTCDEIRQLILDKGWISPREAKIAKHQYEWMCEK